MKRKEFIGISSSVFISTLLGMHEVFAQPRKGTPGPGKAPRITALRLMTSVSLETMSAFYHGVLGLPVLSETKKELTIRAGLSTIQFVMGAGKNERPFYHFAFNIPENKIISALAWQQERTPVIMPRPNTGQKLRDPAYSKDIVHFSHWNAHSVFFLDPAGNLVEYIARHGLSNASAGGFSTADILYVSEIAFIVPSVAPFANELQEALGLKEYRNGSATFMAIGDEQGLLLLITPGIEWTGHVGQKNTTQVFRTEATVYSKTGKGFQFGQYPHTIHGNG